MTEQTPITSTLPLIVEPEQLQAHLEDDDLLIVDLSRQQNHLAGHIPGAVYVSPSELVKGTGIAPGQLPTKEQLEQLFSRIGLKSTTHVVAYDDEGGGWAGRFIWTLDVIGHQRYSYLNGGLIAWAEEKRPLQQELNRPEPQPVKLEIDLSPVAEIDDILPRLQDSNFAVWDARSPEEYFGTRVNAEKAGHIPGAINCEWTQLMDPMRNLRIRTDAAEYLSALGLTKEKEIVTHCQSHHRSGFTYLVGKSLGYKIRGYHGSWSEWGNHPTTPVEI